MLRKVNRQGTPIRISAVAQDEYVRITLIPLVVRAKFLRFPCAKVCFVRMMAEFLLDQAVHRIFKHVMYLNSCILWMQNHTKGCSCPAILKAIKQLNMVAMVTTICFVGIYELEVEKT